MSEREIYTEAERVAKAGEPKLKIVNKNRIIRFFMKIFIYKLNAPFIYIF